MDLFYKLKYSRLFLFGLLIKILAITFLAPEIQDKWFLKFISFSIENFSLDPWSNFYKTGSDPMSYPYGPIMLILQLPMSLIGYFFDSMNFASQAKNYFLSLGFKSSILFADLAILFLLLNLFKKKTQKIVFFYWLSPIAIYISYWHGQLDIFPTFLLILSLFFLKKKNFYISAITLGLSVACKLSMIIAVPFVFFYLLLNSRYHKIVWNFVGIILLTIFFLQGPYFFTLGFQEMILGNPAIDKAFGLNIPVLENFNLYLAPLLYSILIFTTYKIGRMDFNLLYSFLGIAFFIIVIFTEAEIGWYLWVVPFLVAFQIQTNSLYFKYGILIFSLFFVFNKLLIDDGSYVHFFNLDYYYLNKDLSNIFLISIEKISFKLVQDISLGFLSFTGLILIFVMIKKNIFENEFFKLVYKPILIAIAGNSATGKDTLGKALGGVFGENSVASVSGDDYHKYERDSQEWKKFTHLNPKANNLKQFENDCVALKNGNTIICREYDHKIGRFTYKKRIRRKDFILITGLHSLYCKKVRDVADVKIFLEVEDTLRKYFKITRDLRKRKYKKKEIIFEINRRKKDTKLYIEKQKKHADIIFQIDPIKNVVNRSKQKNLWVDTKMKLIIKKEIDKFFFKKVISKIFKKFSYKEIKDYLIVDLKSYNVIKSNFKIELKKISENFEEVLAISPNYMKKEFGIMQFVVLFFIFDKIKRERSRLS